MRAETRAPPREPPTPHPGDRCDDGRVESTRVDKWLWAVRLYPTRTAATDACHGGHVKVNDRPAKPAASVVVGDRVVVRFSGLERVLEVVRVIDKRVGAPIAVECLVDHTPPPTPADESGRCSHVIEPRAGRRSATGASSIVYVNADPGRPTPPRGACSGEPSLRIRVPFRDPSSGSSRWPSRCRRTRTTGESGDVATVFASTILRLQSTPVRQVDGSWSQARSFASASILTGLVASWPETAQAADPVQINLITINDFHGRIERSYAVGRCRRDRDCREGLPDRQPEHGVRGSRRPHRCVDLHVVHPAGRPDDRRPQRRRARGQRRRQPRVRRGLQRPRRPRHPVGRLGVRRRQRPPDRQRTAARRVLDEVHGRRDGRLHRSRHRRVALPGEPGRDRQPHDRGARRGGQPGRRAVDRRRLRER